MKLQELIDSGELNGFKPGWPISHGIVNAGKLDQEVCDESACFECGFLGLKYFPYVSDKHYRAFAVCPRCGDTTEF